MLKLNYLWRLFATAIAFSLFGIGGALIPIIALPIFYILPGGLLKRQLRARKFLHRIFLVFIWMMRLLGILSWKITGLDKLQRPGILVLANHPTLLDAVFLIAFIPNADCIVKKSLLKNPAMRGFVTLAGYITNDSPDTLIDNASSSLKQGSALIIFPEGTRTKPRQKIMLQRGAANIAIRSGSAPTPVIIECTPLTLSKQHKWYHIPEHKVHLTFSVLNEINIDSFMEKDPSLGARHLTNYLRDLFEIKLQANKHEIT
jgi:1-acyl-sn-glycerol-3-phosphate acyltransferase